MASYKPENRRKGDVKHGTKAWSVIYINHSSKGMCRDGKEYDEQGERSQEQIEQKG